MTGIVCKECGDNYLPDRGHGCVPQKDNRPTWAELKNGHLTAEREAEEFAALHKKELEAWYFDTFMKGYRTALEHLKYEREKEKKDEPIQKTST